MAGRRSLHQLNRLQCLILEAPGCGRHLNRNLSRRPTLMTNQPKNKYARFRGTIWRILGQQLPLFGMLPYTFEEQASIWTIPALPVDYHDTGRDSLDILHGIRLAVEHRPASP